MTVDITAPDAFGQSPLTRAYGIGRDAANAVLATSPDGDASAMPNLSGEWADSWTPGTLVGAACNCAPTSIPDDNWEALCDAFDDGVAEAWADR